MPLPTSKKEMRFLWANKPDIAQNKADEIKAAGSSIKSLPEYAHGNKTSTPGARLKAAMSKKGK